MTRNTLVFTQRALDDIARRGAFLSRQRGADFALIWTDALFNWLEKIAAGGAHLGTAHPERPSFRTFGYKRQATILAEFTEGELRVIRIYFAGQDWSQ